MNQRTAPEIDPRVELLHAKLERVDETLSRLWTIQILLVAFALLMVFKPSSSSSITLKDPADFGLSVELSPRVFAVIIGALLLYTFIRFGFVVGQFLVTRAACDRVLPKDPESPLAVLFETTNFFEPGHQVTTFTRRGLATLGFVAVISILVIGLSHFSTIALVFQALGPRSPWAFGLNALVVLVLVGCYRQMWTSNAAGGRFVRGVMVFGPLVTLGLTLVWYVVAT